MLAYREHGLTLRTIRLHDGLNHAFTRKIFVLLQIRNRLT